MCLKQFLMTQIRTGLVTIQYSTYSTYVHMSRFLPMGSTTCDNYGSVLNFRVMQLFPSQPITSPVSCNSRDGGRVEKNV